MKVAIPRKILEKVASKSLSKISISEEDYNSLKSILKMIYVSLKN